VIHRDDVDVSANSEGDVAQRQRLLIRIVFPTDEAPLKGKAPSRRLRVPLTGRHKFFQRVRAVEGNKPVPKNVGRGME